MNTAGEAESRTEGKSSLSKVYQSVWRTSFKVFRDKFPSPEGRNKNRFCFSFKVLLQRKRPSKY